MEQYKTYSDKLNVTLSEENTLDKIILDLRIVKDSYELQLMQKAQDITEEAFNKIVPLIKDAKNPTFILKLNPLIVL